MKKPGISSVQSHNLHKYHLHQVQIFIHQNAFKHVVWNGGHLIGPQVTDDKFLS